MTYHLYYIHLSKAQDYMDSMLWEQEAASSSLATPIRKNHDEPFINAVLSWLYLLHIGLKMAGKCDRSATNSGKTCFVRQCAPLFCMPCLYHTAV